MARVKWLAVFSLVVMLFWFPGMEMVKVQARERTTRFDYYRRAVNYSDQTRYNAVCSRLRSGKISADYIDTRFIEERRGGEEAVLDRRILAMLDLFSFGHSLRVRLIHGYETAAKAVQNEESLAGDYYLSAHFSGTAMDILGADGVDLAWQNSSDPAKRHSARSKIKELLEEILFIASLDQNYLPTQLFVQEAEDVLPHAVTRDRLYGDGSRGSADARIRSGSRRGFSYDFRRDRGRIHIGY